MNIIIYIFLLNFIKNQIKIKDDVNFQLKFVDWEILSKCRYLDLDFIRSNKDKVCWKFISRYQRLYEEFIRQFTKKVDWYSISIYQKLSEDFILEFWDKVDWYVVYKNQKSKIKN